MRKMKKMLFCLIIIPLLTGCAREEVAVNIPVDMEVTKLAQILENPALYDNEKVLLSGVVGHGCLKCPGDFPYQEGADTVEIFTKGFHRPRLRKGQPIRVYAEIKAGEKKVVISALAMEVIK